MFEFAHVFEFVIDAFDDGSFPEQDPVVGSDVLVFHVFSRLGDQLDPVAEKQVRKGFGDVSFISEEFAEEVFSHGFHDHDITVIDVSLGEIK